MRACLRHIRDIQWLRGHNLALFWPPTYLTVDILNPKNVQKGACFDKLPASFCPRSQWTFPLLSADPKWGLNFFEFAQSNSLGFLRFHQDLENLINFIGTWCQLQFYKTLSILCLWSAQHQTLNKKVSKVMKVSHDSKRRKSSVIYFWKCFSCDLESVQSEKWSLNVN